MTSHCWGQEQPLRLLSTNTHRLLQRIEWDELPLTFQHAMTVVRHLGIGYLWIDSLCIQQDSVEDWQSEGARMSIIYTSSYCNIAAVDSTSCQGGLFHDRSPRDLEPYLVSTKWTGSLQRYGMIRENYWSQKLLSKALYGRAWVFQGSSTLTYAVYLLTKQSDFSRHELYTSVGTRYCGNARKYVLARTVLEVYHEPLRAVS